MNNLMSKHLPDAPRPVFEQIKRFDENGNEYWSARDLGKVLEYLEYRNFQPAIERAKEACLNSGHHLADHFVDMHEMVSIGSGAQREMPSIKLSRYACYLIVQNADPGKEVVALGQTYFAVQTRLQEIRYSTELAANLFRATQTEEKLRRENIRGKSKANQTHYDVGKKVRQTIKELGGAMPEDLASEENIKKLENAERKKIGGKSKNPN